MQEHFYEGQRPITPTESYPTPKSSDTSMLKLGEKEVILDSTANEKPRMGHGNITEEHVNDNKDERAASGKPSFKPKKRNKSLEQLLEDASRYDPNCDYSLPTTYKRSGSAIYRNKDNTYHSTLNSSSEEDINQEYNTSDQLKQRPKHKKRRLIKASLLIEGENGLGNKRSHASASIVGDNQCIPYKKDNQITQNISKGLSKMPLKELEERLQQKQLNGEVTEISGQLSSNHNADTVSFLPTSKRGRRPKLQNDNLKSKPTTSIKTTKGKKSISSSLSHGEESSSDQEISNSVEDDETTPGNTYLQTKRTGLKGEEDISTFINWDGLMFNITDTFFDINMLENTSVFDGEIIDSNVITNHHDLANEKSRYSHKFPQKSKKNIPKDILIKLKNPLFSNKLELYAVNFSKDVTKYNPMLEIGKMIEYVALVYLPEPYSTLMKLDIIPQLNEAYDTSNTEYFVQMVEKYNQFIGTVPRNEIINHIKNLKQVPLSFIHDFLQIVYTRAIHPRASQLRHYEAFSNYVYGELLPSFLSKVYHQCDLNQSSTFLDLGSGVGNCVIQASLEYNCKLSAGCEIMKEASDLTESQYKELKERCKLMGLTLMPIKYFLRESFVGHKGVKEVIKDCDVLLINNFLFDTELNKEVEKLLQDVKVGCKIISLKSLRAPGYAVDFYNTDNIMSRLKIEKFGFDEDSVSWTHSGGEYYISTVLDVIDESLLDISNRFRRSRHPIKYSR
ncbi:histone-lysine N-methyltransferase, H3 lysine-79 specific [Monosporozyma servazzii]